MVTLKHQSHFLGGIRGGPGLALGREKAREVYKRVENKKGDMEGFKKSFINVTYIQYFRL